MLIFKLFPSFPHPVDRLICCIHPHAGFYVNIGFHFLEDKYLEIRLWGHVTSVYINVEEAAELLSKVAASVCIFISCVWIPVVSHHHQHIVFFYRLLPFRFVFNLSFWLLRGNCIRQEWKTKKKKTTQGYRTRWGKSWQWWMKMVTTEIVRNINFRI